MEQVRDAYGAAAELYIGLFGTTEQVHAEDLAFVERHLTIPRGKVLDLGCGPGHLTAHLRSLGVDASGIDMVPEFVAHARAAHPGGDYRLGSMTRLAVADHSVTGLLTWYSTIHLPPDELDGVLGEFRRVLVPGGTLVIGFFDGDVVEPFDHKVVTAYRWPPRELSGRLTRAGFTEVELERRPVGEDTRRPHAAIAAVSAG